MCEARIPKVGVPPDRRWIEKTPCCTSCHVGGTPDESQEPSGLDPWSLVEPLLAVSNQLINLGETLTGWTLSAITALLGAERDEGRVDSGVHRRSGRPPNPAQPEDPQTSLASPISATPLPLPEIQASNQLHLVPCGGLRVFLWYRLDSAPERDASSGPLQLRESRTDTGTETRRVDLRPKQTSLYLELPTTAGPHRLEIGQDRGGSWTPCSTPLHVQGVVRGRGSRQPDQPRIDTT